MNAQTAQQVALTGGGGFVGRAVLKRLTQTGRRVKALVHAPHKQPTAAQRVVGDLFDDAALDALLDGCDALVHLVGIIREDPARGKTFDRIHHRAVARLLERAKAHGIKRYIHMSALGTRDGAPSEYHRTKWLGEQAVRSSGLDWTILRPTLILGPGGEFAQMLTDFWTKPLPPFVPYFGKGALGLGGSGRAQPIAVADVAHCFVEALNRKRTAGGVYELGGPDVMDWPTMYRRVGKLIEGAKNKPVLPVPIWWAKLLASVPGLRRILPFNRAQVIMAAEDVVCDTGPMRRDFDLNPLPLEAAWNQE